MTTPVLHTPRCMITIMTEKDAGWLNTLLNDEGVQHYIEGIRLFSKTVENTTEYVKCMFDAYNNRRGFLWKVTYKKEPIGFVCTIDFDENPFLSFAIIKKFRHHGLMRENLKAVLSYQNHISNKKYLVDISIENVYSYKLCRRLIDDFDVVMQTN